MLSVLSPEGYIWLMYAMFLEGQLSPADDRLHLAVSGPPQTGIVPAALAGAARRRWPSAPTRAPRARATRSRNRQTPPGGEPCRL